MRRLLVIGKFEFLMHVRKANFWILSFILSILAMIDTMPSANNLRMDYFKDHLYVAGRIFGTNLQFIVIVLVFLTSNKVLEDKRLNTIDVIMAKPLSIKEYYLGKFTGNFFVCLLMVVIILITCLVPQVMMHPTPFKISPYILSLIALALPAIIFVSSVSTVYPVLFRSTKIYYVVFLVYWIMCVFIQENDNMRYTFFKFAGENKLLFYKELAGFNTTLAAIINIGVLILFSVFSLGFLIYRKNRSGERTLL